MNPCCIHAQSQHFMSFATSFRFLRCHSLSLTVVAHRRCLQGTRTAELRFLTKVEALQQRRLFSLRASSKKIEEGNGAVASVRGESGGDGDDGTHDAIIDFELPKDANDGYMTYAMSVLLGRALPDVRDGLKPVHRRILYAMHELGLSSKKPYRKCARVVGEVLGKFHPHGDSAVYDSLVRMAQDFSLRSPLIRGHGNFGTIDSDPPAAMRYTECRLEALSEAMLLADLEQDTVNFIPNFDDSQREPSLLPARIPNVLLNGSSGIAVGMATNIPPHNLGELVDALTVLIHNPEATLQELLEYMPGPDFPTGGTIMGNMGILEAYRTGKGRVVIRGKTDIELLDSKTKRSAIVIKEIPYQTSKSALAMKIDELVANKSLEGISDVRDESDISGIRIVLEVKGGSDPSKILNNLYRLTTLQSTFSCNMVGILDGQPKLMGLKELLQAFLDFRCSVVERRARFKLSQAKDRFHIVEGILIGLNDLDKVIQIIRKSSSNAMASVNLMEEFSLTERQAEAVLDISLRKLTSLEKNKFTDEEKSLLEQISNLQELLSSKKLILKMIEEEANEIKVKFFTPRRSVIDDNDYGEVEDIDIIPNEEMLLALSEKGYLKRMKPDTFNLQNRGTIGKSVGKLRVNDTLSDFIVCQTHDRVLYFSDKGTVYSAYAFKIPECTRAAAGTPLVQILSLSEGEKITSIVPVKEFDGDQYLVMLTVKGYIKKVPGDTLRWVRRCSNDDLVAMASQNGMVILSPCKNIRALGRNTRGGIAMRLKEGDKMASMDIIPASLAKKLEEGSHADQTLGPWLLFISESGYGKRVPVSSFKESRLNRVGLKGYKFSSDDRMAAVFVVGLSTAEDGGGGGGCDEQVVLVSQSGTVNRIKVRDISVQSRFARGVILMRLEYGGRIRSASLMTVSEAAATTDSDELVETAAS